MAKEEPHNSLGQKKHREALESILYAALDKTFFFDPWEAVCCSPMTVTSWNV
jgi:hypothetical protein